MDPLIITMQAASAIKLAGELTGVIESIEKRLDRIEQKIDQQNEAHLNTAFELIRKASLSQNMSDDLLDKAHLKLEDSLNFEQGARKASALLLLGAYYEYKNAHEASQDALLKIFDRRLIFNEDESALKMGLKLAETLLRLQIGNFHLPTLRFRSDTSETLRIREIAKEHLDPENLADVKER